MNDLISRQDAIDAVSEALERVFVEHEDIAKKIIGKVSSAETRMLEGEDVDSLISKLSEIRSDYNCFDKDEEPYYHALSAAIKILHQLWRKDE